MTQDEYRAQAYRLGHHFVRKLLGLGKAPGTIRRDIDRAQEHLLTLGAYSAELDRMKRLGAEDALAGKAMDGRYAAPGSPRGGVWDKIKALWTSPPTRP
jgi:hypothetical protein